MTKSLISSKNLLYFNMTFDDLFLMTDQGSNKYDLLLEAYTPNKIFTTVTLGDTWIIGLTYMKQYYSIFDVDNMRVGMILPNPDA